MADDSNRDRSAFDPTRMDEILGGETGVVLRKFVNELEGIRKGIDAAVKIAPKAIAEAAKAHADYYQTGSSSVGGSRATAQSPSGTAPGITPGGLVLPQGVPTPILPQSPPSVPSPQYSHPVGPSRPPVSGQGTLFDNPYTQQGGQGSLFPPESFGGRYSDPPSPEIGRPSFKERLGHFAETRSSYRAFREAASARGVGGKFNAFSEAFQVGTPIYPHYSAHQTATDEEEEASGTYEPGGPSLPPDAPDGPGGGGSGGRGRRPPGSRYGRGDWRRYIDEDVVDEPLKIPRAGHFTAEDVLDLLGDTLAKHALRREADVEGSGRTSGNAAMWMYRAAHSWAPKAALIRQYWDRIEASPYGPSNLEALGASQGISPGTGFGSNINLPFGMGGIRIPFLNPGAREGMKIRASELWQARQSGLNKSQVGNIYNELGQRGWFYDSPRFGPMRDSLQHLTQWNPDIGQNPMTADMLDKVTRMGVTSISDFMGVMKQIPDAAKAAHVSLQQMQGDMDQMGELNQQQGGTYLTGTNSAAAFARLTGMPAAVQIGAAQNPFIQMQATTQYGLAPWQQGLMSPEMRANTTIGGVMQMYKALGPMPSPITHTDAAGFKQTISGKQQQIANLHMLFPEMSYEALTRIVNSGKRMQSGIRAEQAMRDYSTRAGQISHSKMSPQAKEKALSHLFDKHGGQGSWEAINREMIGAGFSKEERSDVISAGGFDIKGMSGSSDLTDLSRKAATKQFKKFEEILSKKNQDMTDQGSSNGQTMIGLTQDAKALVKVLGNNKYNKLKSAAGIGSTNSIYGNGPTSVDLFPPGG